MIESCYYKKLIRLQSDQRLMGVVLFQWTLYARLAYYGNGKIAGIPKTPTLNEHDQTPSKRPAPFITPCNAICRSTSLDAQKSRFAPGSESQHGILGSMLLARRSMLCLDWQVVQRHVCCKVCRNGIGNDRLIFFHRRVGRRNRDYFFIGRLANHLRSYQTFYASSSSLGVLAPLPHLFLFFHCFLVLKGSSGSGDAGTASGWVFRHRGPTRGTS